MAVSAIGVASVARCRFGLYGVACLLLTRWYMTRRRALMARAVVVFVLAAAGGVGWLSLESNAAWRRQHPLVVIRTDRLPLRKGNGPSYEVNADLPQLARAWKRAACVSAAAGCKFSSRAGAVGLGGKGGRSRG